MPLRVGDLVAEDYNLYWKFSSRSYVWIRDESDPSVGEPKQIIGIIISVHKRFPDAFFEIPYYVYKIKWLNAPEGIMWDDKYFYGDELVLLSRVSREEPDPEFELEMNFEREEE